MTSLPALTGSPKQIAWAEQIRAGLDTSVHAEVERMVDKRCVGRGYGADVCDALRAILTPAMTTAALRQTDAQWWIDNRGGNDRFAGKLPTPGERAWRLMTADEKSACNEAMAAATA